MPKNSIYRMKNMEIKEWFTLVIAIVFITDLVILFDILYLRPFIGFLFLTFLPGLLILQILKLNKMGSTEKFVLSVGLSISFLMLFGLLLNNLSLSIGYETPLGTIPLLISFNIAFVALGVIGYRVNKDPIISLPNLNLSTSEKAFLIIPIFFPVLSIFGMHIMNTTDNNTILIFLLFLIPVYIIFIYFFNHKFPKRLYPIVIFLISVSLMLLMALRSYHLIGNDVHTEYYFFQTTLNNLHWKILGRTPLDACLSISLLPTIYQSISNINPELLFKILYSLIVSISPIAIYILSKRYIGESYAFLVSFFFVSQPFFLYVAGSPRTSIAILFFALAMMTIFNDKIDPLKKRILFIVFMVSCMVSHYSTTYIFFFIMFGVFVGMEILSKKYTFKKVVSLTIVVLFFSLIFFWYSQVTETAFNAGVTYIENTFINLNKFFIEESRDGGIQYLLGQEAGEEEIPYKIILFFAWMTFAFIGIGIITLIRRYREMSFPELNFKKPDFLKEKFEVGYFVIALTCAGLLIAVVAFPFVSTGYDLGRTYVVATVILSVFFVIGGITLSNFSFIKKDLLKKQKEEKNALDIRAYLVILLVLIPYSFCGTGMMYQVFGVPRVIILNSEGPQYGDIYIHDQESCAAKWLGHYATERQRIYVADYFGARRLTSQAMISPLAINSDALIGHRKTDGYIYLIYHNIVNGELRHHGETYNMTDYQDVFVKKNEIYDSGCSKVLR